MDKKYKLKKNEYGKVNYLMRAGKDLVKSQMNPFSAQHVIDNGKYTETVDPNYPIAIDDTWFFEGEEITTAIPSAPAEETSDNTSEEEPKEESKPSFYGDFRKGAKKK